MKTRALIAAAFVFIAVLVASIAPVSAQKSGTPRLKLVCDLTARELFQIIEIPKQKRLENARVTVVLWNTGFEKELWRWEGITDSNGKVDVKIKDYITFQTALVWLRDHLNQGRFVLTSGNLRGVTPLAKTRCMNYVKPL